MRIEAFPARETWSRSPNLGTCNGLDFLATRPFIAPHLDFCTILSICTPFVSLLTFVDEPSPLSLRRLSRADAPPQSLIDQAQILHYKIFSFLPLLSLPHSLLTLIDGPFTEVLCLENSTDLPATVPGGSSKWAVQIR